MPQTKMPTNVVTVDFETYYDDTYSLKKLDTIPYVRDAQFKVHGCSMKVNDNPAKWVTAKNVKEELRKIDWHENWFAAHHTLFDGLVAAEIYGIYPPWLTDTVGLARALLPPGLNLSLESLAPMLGLGVKGTTLSETKGVRELNEEQEKTLATYAIQDAELCYKIFTKLWPSLPEKERYLLSMTLRMGTQATLHFDAELATKAMEEEKLELETAITKAGVNRKVLQSNQQFADHIRSLGLEPPTKKSPTTGETTYAFAKNDLAFLKFRAAHPEHSDLWEARIASKGDGNVKRIKKLLDFTKHGTEKLPMPLKFCGAHTFRWSGTGGFNVQNFKRGSKTRKAITAPKGYVIVVADSSQIELRMNAWFSGEERVLKVLRSGGDIYSHTASEHFGYPVNKKDNPNERQFGKMLELALGFAMWWPTLQTNAAIGFMGCPKVVLSDAEAYNAVINYRNTHARIAKTWKFLDSTIIPGMTYKGFNHEHKCVVFTPNAVQMPNGLELLYWDLAAEEQGFYYGIPKHRKKIYGGLFDENLVQSLARIVVADQMVEIDKTEGIHMVTSTHDEAVALVKEQEAEDALKYMLDVMRTPPSWAPDLPLDAEGGYDVCYSK